MSMPTSSKATVDPAAPTAASSNGPAAAPTDVQPLVTAPKQRHPALLLVSIVLVVIIVAAAISFFVTSGGHESTNDAYVEGRVVRISPKVSGQLISLRVDDNDA